MPGNGKFTLEFNIEDIPMLVDVMSLASATAVMYGGKNNGICDRFQEFQKQFEEHSPIPGKYRNEGYAWFQACTAAYRAETVEVAFLVPENHLHSYRETQGRISIIVDGEVFHVTDLLKEDEAAPILSKVIASLEASIEPRTRLVQRIEGYSVIDTCEVRDKDKTASYVAEVLNNQIDGLDIIPSDVHEVERSWRKTPSDDLMSVKFTASVPHYLADQINGKDFSAPGPTSAPGL